MEQGEREGRKEWEGRRKKRERRKSGKSLKECHRELGSRVNEITRRAQSIREKVQYTDPYTSVT